MLPQYSPLFPTEGVKYEDYRRLSIYGEADKDGVQALLPDELEYVSSEIEAFVLDAPQVSGFETGYLEGGIVVRAQYGETDGAHMLCEFVTDAGAIGAGREMYGYPKKDASVELTEDDGHFQGIVKRNGTPLIESEFVPADVSYEPPTLFPRLQVKQIPRADGEGYDVNQIIKMGFTGDDHDFDPSDVKSRTAGTGTLTLNGTESDPLDRLGPVDVTGAAVTVGDFELTPGEIVDDLTDVTTNG